MSFGLFWKSGLLFHPNQIELWQRQNNYRMIFKLLEDEDEEQKRNVQKLQNYVGVNERFQTESKTSFEWFYQNGGIFKPDVIQSQELASLNSEQEENGNLKIQTLCQRPIEFVVTKTNHFQPLLPTIEKSIEFQSRQNFCDAYVQPSNDLQVLNWIYNTCMTQNGNEKFELLSFKPVVNPSKAFRFQFQRQWLSQKNNVKSQVTIAFHGTSDNDPEKVACEGLSILKAKNSKGIYLSSDPIHGCTSGRTFTRSKRKSTFGAKHYRVLVCAVALGNVISEDDMNDQKNQKYDTVRYSSSYEYPSYNTDCLYVNNEDSILVLGVLEMVEKTCDLSSRQWVIFSFLFQMLQPSPLKWQTIHFYDVPKCSSLFANYLLSIWK
jgi:hypothetical protein